MSFACWLTTPPQLSPRADACRHHRALPGHSFGDGYPAAPRSLSADIRANVTSSIALRVQSEAESMDIINTKAAASISVGAPGRAYLATASCSPPEEFQTASLSVSPTMTMVGVWRNSSLPTVQSAFQALEPLSAAANTSAKPDSLHDAGAEGGVVSAVHEAWQRLCKPIPRRPVAPPLPSTILWGGDELPEADGPVSTTEGQWAVGPLAMLDRPAHQVVEPLLWSPSKDGHLAMIGSDSSGIRDCFRAASAMLATQKPQPDLYILDARGGILGHVIEGGRIGASVGLHQLHLAVRVLKRLAAEMECRRSAGEAGTANSPLVLIVAGWCSWATALRSGPFGYAEAILQDIVRDGCSVGVTVLISGERELVSSRFFARYRIALTFLRDLLKSRGSTGHASRIWNPSLGAPSSWEILPANTQPSLSFVWLRTMDAGRSVI